MAKYKATGCARFFFFLIIFVPVAYFGSQYLMETGKWDQIRDKLEEVSSSKERSESSISPETESISPEIKKRLERLLEKVNEQAQKLEEQEEIIHRQNVLIDQLKQQLETRDGESGTKNDLENSTEENKLSLEEFLKEADKIIKN